MACRPKVGGRHLTASGLPVQVVRVDDAFLALQSLVSDNRFTVPRGYDLRPFAEANSRFEMRPTPYTRCPDGAENRPPARPPTLLAPLIDAMLLAGGKTMRGILRELRRRASASCKGKDLAANVRARLYWFKRKGYRLEKTGQNLRLTPPAATASQ